MFAVGMLLLGVNLCHGKKSQVHKNQLNKVYHHQMHCDAQEKNASLELGSLVCYFSQPPLVNSLTEAHEKKDQNAQPVHQQLVFFFPGVSIVSVDAKSGIEKLHKEANDWYTIQFQEVKAPTQGIKLSLTFDPRKVGLKYDVFDSIKQEKGVVFRFFNQETLRTLSTKSCKPVLNVAHMRKPSLIAIDCGHGGTDLGTVGMYQYKEKDVTLNIGRELASMLEKEGFKTILTRNADVTISLDARTTLANNKRADVLISIHANNAPSATARGIETFFMDPALLTFVDSTMDEAYRNIVACNDREKFQASGSLAREIHRHVLESITLQHQVKDRSVRKSVSQMLLGAYKPSVLMEVGFLSHPEEAKFLGQPDYQKLIAQGICNGVKRYAELVG